MYYKKSERPIVATLPDGSRIYRSDLPPVNITRWVMRNKLAVVNGVLHGLLGFDEACQIYDLSSEELQSWVKLSHKHGKEALKATRLAKFRQL